MNVMVINGPNLNLLGEREPEMYGHATLADLEAFISAYARERAIDVRFAQHNAEGAIIDELHAARRWANGIVLNPAAYTHYSYAIRDAIAAIRVPVVEVHLTDISKREAWRISVTSDVCMAQIAGLGFESYLRAIDALAERHAPRA